MKGSRLKYVPIGAMAVAFAWSSLVAEPQRESTPYPLPATEVAPSNWQADAGQIFGVPPAQVESAMTEQEWQVHQKKMVAMQPEQRARYQKEVRQQIVERIRTGGLHRRGRRSPGIARFLIEAIGQPAPR